MCEKRFQKRLITKFAQCARRVLESMEGLRHSTEDWAVEKDVGDWDQKKHGENGEDNRMCEKIDHA